MNTNKSSFFKVEFNYSELEIGSFMASQEISTSMDLVLQAINSSSEIYRFTNNNKIIYLFSTQTRKREGQLFRLVNKYIYKTNLYDIMERPKITGLLKKDFQQEVFDLQSDKTLLNKEKPLPHPNYSGEDLKILDDRNNWYKWQLKIYERLFYASGELKPAPPEDRTIVFLYDPEGCSGKSTFFKWLMFHYGQEIGYLTIGTASQLRSAACKIPHRSIYLCDLARSTGDQDSSRIADLASVLEELKTGAIASVMYGKYDLILQNKSHILVSSNFLLNPYYLSKDRLEILKIENNDLKNITEETIHYFDELKRKKKYQSVEI